MSLSSASIHRRSASRSDLASFFSFRAIAPPLSDAVLKRFIAVDHALGSSTSSLAAADLVDFVANGFALRNPDSERTASASAAFHLLSGSISGDLLAELTRANSLLCGQSGMPSTWRAAPVWVGRVPRERSVAEGADPKEIPRLMAVWSKLHERSLPLSLLIAVSTLRFLQIHPFLDGNGRSARWMALRLARRNPSLFDGLSALILGVWAKGAAFRHACSASVVECGDWGPWLDAWSSYEKAQFSGSYYKGR